MTLPQIHVNRRTALAVFAVLLSAAVAGCSAATRPAAAGIEVSQVWARAVQVSGSADAGAAAMPGANSVVYLVLTNPGDAPDRLLSAASDVARALEIHDTVLVDDVMIMQQVSDGVEIPAHGRVEIKPGGLHIMLIGLTDDLLPGETFPLTLQFERAGALTIEAEVRQP